MKVLYSKSISCYASDTAGVCSALFELGGMTIVHDASGCNSTYATHDEPRWFGSNSMTYISALTENDVVLGNDRKLIEDTVRAAKELHPEFIAFCNSPIPLMVGCDMQAIAAAVESELDIPCFAVPANGMKHYWQGAAMAWKMLAERILPPETGNKVERGINVLGATPLDFSLNGNVEAIVDFLRQREFAVQSVWAMDNTLENLKKAVNAQLNLVISNSGLPLAEYMLEKYSIPFVCGVPLGIKGSAALAEKLEETLVSKENSFWCAERRCDSSAECVIAGEAVFAGSLAQTLQLEKNLSCCVADPLSGNRQLLSSGDVQLAGEKELKNFFAGKSTVIADNMYNPIISSGSIVMNIPHEAFSGRCYHKARLNLVNRQIDWEKYLCRK